MRLIIGFAGFIVFLSAFNGRVPASAAERIVYVGTYTGEASKGIYAFRFDDVSGTLSPLGLAAETPSPSFLIASADARFVFAVNELQSFKGDPSGSVTSFAVDPKSAKLAELSVQSSKGSGPCHLALDRTGRYLAVANYSGGNYALLPVVPGWTAATSGERRQRRGRRFGQGARAYGGLRCWQPVSDSGRQGLGSNARVSLRRADGRPQRESASVRHTANRLGTTALRISSEWATAVHDQ